MGYARKKLTCAHERAFLVVDSLYIIILIMIGKHLACCYTAPGKIPIRSSYIFDLYTTTLFHKLQYFFQKYTFKKKLSMRMIMWLYRVRYVIRGESSYLDTLLLYQQHK